MLRPGPARRVTIYLGESDQCEDRPTYAAILDLLRTESAAGATVHQAITGFGAHSRVRRVAAQRASTDTPLVITWVDRPDRVERILPHIEELVTGGLVTVEDVDVVRYTGHAQDAATATIGEIMTTDVVTVAADEPVVAVADKLLGREFSGLPVVDAQNHVIGIVSDGDLIERAGMKMRLGLKRLLAAGDRHPYLEHLRSSPLRVREVMTAPASTIAPEITVATAARMMSVWKVARLPVADRDGRLVGIVGRGDLLRCLAHGGIPPRPRPAEEESDASGAFAARTVAEIARSEVATVSATTALDDVVERAVAAPERVVVVLDDARRPLGIVTDTDLLRRIAPELRPGILAGLTRGVHRHADALDALHGTHARDVMSSPVISVRDTASPVAALSLAVEKELKRLPVVDAGGRLVGLVSRHELLGAFVSPEPPDQVA